MQTILFIDIDSTLIENHFSARIMRHISAEIAAHNGLDADAVHDEITREYQQRAQTDPNNPLTMDWDDITTTVAARHGVVLSEHVDPMWTRMSRTHIDEIEVLDEAPQVLEQLKEGHRRLVIATKGLSKYQTPVMTAVDLLPYFDDYLTPDRTGYLKTEPGFFGAYEGLRDRARFIHIGDHYYDDVICARRNGFFSVMRAPIAALASLDPFDRPQHIAEVADQIRTYPATGTDVRPHAVVVSLTELSQVVGRIEAWELG